jgi:hypothetical protein
MRTLMHNLWMVCKALITIYVGFNGNKQRATLRRMFCLGLVH